VLGVLLQPDRRHNSQLAMPFTDSQSKQLVQDVETSGVSRHECNFLQICNQSDFYGEKGSTKRRAFQKKWSYLKTYNIKQYSRLLRRLQVLPSAVTQREQQKKQPLQQQFILEEEEVEEQKEAEEQDEPPRLLPPSNTQSKLRPSGTN
jgi:hypothetical protein